MTENDARAWIERRFGTQATERVGDFLERVARETTEQNLVAPSTVTQMWSRHALDSAQLVPLAPSDGTWLDIGTGGGFPGMVVALLREAPILMVEPRRRRAEFLQRCVDELNLAHAEVRSCKAEAVAEVVAVVSARAVSSVENILHAARRSATSDTRWLLPRGRSGSEELAALRENWIGMFHVEQSLTDSESTILVLDAVSRR